MTSRCRSFRSAGTVNCTRIGGDDFLVDVAQHVEGEPVFLRGREAVVGGLGADGQEGRAVGLEARKGSLQGPELEVAEGAPLTTVERDHDRSLREAVEPTRRVHRARSAR